LPGGGNFCRAGRQFFPLLPDVPKFRARKWLETILTGRAAKSLKEERQLKKCQSDRARQHQKQMIHACRQALKVNFGTPK
jgi:hypothetical protein